MVTFFCSMSFKKTYLKIIIILTGEFCTYANVKPKLKTCFVLNFQFWPFNCQATFCHKKNTEIKYEP